MPFTSPPPPDEAPLLEWALWYASQDWPVFPCYGKAPITIIVKNGLYDATCDEATIRHWWAQWPQANIGMPVQTGSVVLDVDPRKGGDTTLHLLQQGHGPLPETLTSHTGGGGLHLFFTSSVTTRNKTDWQPGIDTKAPPGGYVVVPPSIHPDTGKRYVWDVESGPDTLRPQHAPSWLETLLTYTVDAPREARDPQAPILEGTRETTLMALAGAMQRIGASPDAIRSALEAENQRCVPPLDAADLDRMTRSVGRYAPAPRLEVSAYPVSRPAESPVMPPQDIPLADYFNARALVETHGADIRYCETWRSWLVWRGLHWRRDDMGQVMQWAKGTVMAMLGKLQDIPDAKARDAFYRHIKASLATGRLKAMVESANNEPGIRVLPEDFDRQLWLLNCTNGTLDLRTGTLQPHSRNDLLMKCLPIPYDPQAHCPTWERFLWRVMGGSIDPDNPDDSAAVHQKKYEADEQAKRLIGFLQRAVGYALTGSTREQCLFFVHGPGKTGKSTFLATIKALLGPYGKQAEMSTFMYKEQQEVRNDLADLAGSRLVTASESEKDKRLAENLIKQLTGGVDLIKARFLFQEYFEFKPQFKVFLASNHMPIIRDTDSAIWERIRRVQFDVFIPPDERDKTLDDHLQQELSGILAWAVRGCLEWQRYDDLKPPPEVIQSTADYRQEMDTFGQFLTECCFRQHGLVVKVGTLNDAYQAWCLDNGHKAESLHATGKRLDDMGHIKEPKRRKTGWFRVGIGLFTPSTEEEDR